jgi:hypothetical protein
MSFGLSIGGTIFVNFAQSGLYSILPGVPRNDISQLISGTSGALFASLTQELQDRVREVIVDAWQKMYGISTAFLI